MIDWSQRGPRLEQIRHHWHDWETYDIDTVPFLLELVDELSLDLGIAKHLLEDQLSGNAELAASRDDQAMKFFRGEPIGDPIR